MKKKNNESESLGLMVARRRSEQVKRDWSKLSPDQKLASLRKDREDLKKRMADHEKSMKEGKNHTWKSEGHYTKDGKEWSGPQHAHDGQVMTGEKHTADSQNLYHFKALSPEVKKKVLEKMKMDEGIVDTIMKSKTLNKSNYNIAAKELEKKMKKDPSKSKMSHAHDVAKYVKNVDARKLAAEDYIKEEDNITTGHLHKLYATKDLETAKKHAHNIVHHWKETSKKKITKDKAEFHHRQIDNHNSVHKVHKHMTDLYLSGQGHGVIGNKYSTKKNAYRGRFRDSGHGPTAKRAHGSITQEFEMTGCPLLEKLSPSDGIGKYVKDFKKSDAPQFKGASASKRRKMAVAAYLGAKRKKLAEGMAYDSTMGVMDRGLPKGTEYMKDNTPGESTSECKSCEGRGCSHCNYRGSMNRKIEAPVKFAEETEAGETKKKYREDNADVAPEAGIVPLSKDDIANLYAEIETMTYDDMEEYGFFDDEDDEYDSTIEWDDFDFEDVDIVDTDYKVTTSEGVEHIFTLDEVLSVQGRLKRRFAARKNRQKLKVARNIALRRGSSPDRLKKRATRGARSMVYKRLLKGRDKSSMPPAEKARFERLIVMYQPLIQRFAQRMLPKMRKMEITRMKNRRGKAPQKSKKYKASKPIARASSQKAKKFKVKR